MRELARCISWTLAVGAVALLVAMFTSVGIAQSDGPLAWLVFAVYSPFYLVSHVLGPDPSQARLNALFIPSAFAAQFLYFFVFVAASRYLSRKSGRRA
jgi:hypothetical protein